MTILALLWNWRSVVIPLAVAAVAGMAILALKLELASAREDLADERQISERLTGERNRAIETANANADAVAQAIHERDTTAALLTAARAADTAREEVVRTLIKEVRDAPPPNCPAYPGLVRAHDGVRSLVLGADADRKPGGAGAAAR